MNPDIRRLLDLVEVGEPPTQNTERYKQGATELVGSEPGQFARQVAAEMERWTDVVKRAGIKAD